MHVLIGPFLRLSHLVCDFLVMLSKWQIFPINLHCWSNTFDADMTNPYVNPKVWKRVIEKKGGVAMPVTSIKVFTGENLLLVMLF